MTSLYASGEARPSDRRDALETVLHIPLPAWLEPHLRALEPWLPWITAVGVLMALISMLAIPWMLVRMPTDYFNAPSRPTNLRSPLVWLIWFARNALAAILLLAGIAMLVLPGQGLLTIVIAIMASTFPGKYRLERAIMRRPGILRAVNWIRGRRDKPPLDPPLDSEGEVSDAD